MKRIKCKIKGHKLSPLKRETAVIKEYECTQCNQKFTIDGYGQLVKLTQFWIQNNMLFEKFYQNKRAS